MPNHRIGCLGAPGAPKALSPILDLTALGAQGAQGLTPYLILEYGHLLYSMLDSHLPGRQAPSSHARPGSYRYRGISPILSPSSWGVNPVNPSIH